MARNSATLIVGLGLAQTIPVLLQPILRRMFSPEDFALFAIYFAIVSTLAIVANFRYAQVIVIPSDDKDAQAAVSGGILLSFCFSVLICIVLIFFGPQMVALFKYPASLNKWLFLIPLSTFLISASMMINGWLTRKKRFKQVAYNKMLRRTGEGAAQVTFGAGKYYAGGLMVGSVIGDFTNFISHLWQYRRNGGRLFGHGWQNIKTQLHRFREFPIYNLTPTLLDTLALFLPLMIINALYSDEVTAQYDLSRQILQLPLALISMAVSQVILQKIAEKSRNGKRIMPTIRSAFLGLFALSIPGVLLLWIFGVEIFTFVFGENWGQAGEMTTVLIFSYALRFMTSPLSVVFIAIEKIKIGSFWQIFYFLLICILFALKDTDIRSFLLWLVWIDIAAYLVYLGLIVRSAVRHDNAILNP